MLQDIKVFDVREDQVQEWVEWFWEGIEWFQDGVEWFQDGVEWFSEGVK